MLPQPPPVPHGSLHSLFAPRSPSVVTWWLTPALGIQYILTKGGGGGGEAAVRGWGSAHVARVRLMDVDEKMVTQRDDGFSAGGGITKEKQKERKQESFFACRWRLRCGEAAAAGSVQFPTGVA